MVETTSGVYLKRLPILREFGNLVSSNIRDFGLNQGVFKSLKDLGIELTIDNLTPETSDILRSQPCIVIGNHPTLTEPLALAASLPPRDDEFLVMSQSFLSLIPSVEPHILPIYLWSQKGNERAMNRVLRKLLTYGEIDYEQAHQRNIKSISIAADRISEGHLGMIFPAPPTPSKINHWKPGIGYLIEGIKTPSQTYLVQAYIEGTTQLDILKVLPGLRHIRQNIKVTLKDPQKISTLDDKRPKALEKDYINWVDFLNRNG